MLAPFYTNIYFYSLKLYHLNANHISYQFYEFKKEYRACDAQHLDEKHRKKMCMTQDKRQYSRTLKMYLL